MEKMVALLWARTCCLVEGAWADCGVVDTLLGKKTVLNEFIAYIDLQSLMKEKAISERAVVIATYALCGFANIGSIGIQIGGISAISEALTCQFAPSRRADLAKLGLRTMVAGTLPCFMTACIAGILL